MPGRIAHHRRKHTSGSHIVRASLAAGLMIVTMFTTAGFAQAHRGKAPVGYAQSELRRASQKIPRELRSYSYATDEFGRPIITESSSLPTHYTSNGQAVKDDPTADAYYYGFDGRPLDDPFRVADAQLPGVDSEYYGSNGQALEFELNNERASGLYGSNGAPIDAAMLNGMTVNGTPSSQPEVGKAAGATTAAKSMGGDGMFRRDRPLRRPASIAGGDQQDVRATPIPYKLPFTSLASEKTESSDTGLSPLLPLLDYDKGDDEWFDSPEDEPAPSIYSKKPSASNENAEANPKRASFALPRHGVGGNSPFPRTRTSTGGVIFGADKADSPSNASGPSNLQRWPGRAVRQPAPGSQRKPVYHSPPTLRRSLSSN